MSRIYKISKIGRIRKTRLQVRKDLNVYSLRPYRRARACPSPTSDSQKASRRGRSLLLPCPAPLCRSRSPDLDPFAIRRSRTTEACLARPRRSRGTGPRATGPQHLPFYRRARACPSPTSVSPKAHAPVLSHLPIPINNILIARQPL